MPAPNAANIQGDLYIETFLTNYSYALLNDAIDYVAGAASSRIPVQKQSGKYRTYDRGSFLRDEMQPRPLGGRPMQVGYKLGSASYDCEEYALEHFIDDRQRANADNQIGLDQNATRLLTTKSKIKRDRTWSQEFFKPGVWTFDVSGAAASPDEGAGEFLQFDQDGSDPIGVIDAKIDAMSEATGFVPNTLVLGTKTRRVLRTNADISDRIKYTQTGVASDQILASLFSLGDQGRVITPRSSYNAAAEGADDDFKFIVPDDGMWLGYIDRNATVDSPTAIGMFAWTGLADGMANEEGGVIWRGRDDRAHSDLLQIQDAWDMGVVAKDLGVYFSSVVG